MYDFERHLQIDERILYQGKAHPNKGSKGILGILLLIGFSLFIQIVLIWSVVTKTGDGANGISLTFILIFLTALLFLGLGIYKLVYNLFLKKRQVADDFYCLTNKRVMKYELKKDKLVYGYLENYADIQCFDEKDNYGDVYFGIVMEDSGDAKTTLSKLKDAVMNPDITNMPCITFESICNPRFVATMAYNARIELLKNK